MKNFNDDYYAGFDIGTDSVGYAVADTDYNLCKFKGNAMWGVDLFEESNSAAERRTLRSARRRGLRKRNRIEWLQMLFDEEISKVDNAFYQRLKESCLYLDDKSSNVPYAVLNRNQMILFLCRCAVRLSLQSTRLMLLFL